MLDASCVQHRPASVASAMPSKKPLGDVSGVLKSPCASNQMTAVRSPPSEDTVPSELAQLPESTSGKLPRALADEAHTLMPLASSNAAAASVVKGVWLSQRVTLAGLPR